MGQNRDGFLHPAGALTAREKNGLSAAPARSAEPLYPSNDPGEGRVPADWKSAASRPACSGHRPPLTPPRAMKKPTVSPAPARPAPATLPPSFLAAPAGESPATSKDAGTRGTDTSEESAP